MAVNYKLACGIHQICLKLADCIIYKDYRRCVNTAIKNVQLVDYHKVSKSLIIWMYLYREDRSRKECSIPLQFPTAFCSSEEIIKRIGRCNARIHMWNSGVAQFCSHLQRYDLVKINKITKATRCLTNNLMHILLGTYMK